MVTLIFHILDATVAVVLSFPKEPSTVQIAFILGFAALLTLGQILDELKRIK